MLETSSQSLRNSVASEEWSLHHHRSQRKADAPIVVLIDGEKSFPATILASLSQNGFRIDALDVTDDLVDGIVAAKADAVLLRSRIRARSGFELCREIRARPATRNLPIIVLYDGRWKARRQSRVETGASDILATTIDPRDLTDRLLSFINRLRAVGERESLRLADVTIDLAALRASHGQRGIHLSPYEFRVLEYLARHQGGVVRQADLIAVVWGHDPGANGQTVRRCICRLRKALRGTVAADLVQTIPKGYRVLTERSAGVGAPS